MTRPGVGDFARPTGANTPSASAEVVTLEVLSDSVGVETVMPPAKTGGIRRVEHGSSSFPQADSSDEAISLSVTGCEVHASGDPATHVAASSAPAVAVAANLKPSRSLERGVGPSSANPVARNIDLGTYKEICLRADSSAAVAAAAEQLPQVLERDRSSAEKEVLEQAMICLAEETTVAGMNALATVVNFLGTHNVNIYKGAYNGRAEALNKKS